MDFDVTEKKLSECLKEGDIALFRKSGEEGFLLMYQNAKQKHLLQRLFLCPKQCISFLIIFIVWIWQFHFYKNFFFACFACWFFTKPNKLQSFVRYGNHTCFLDSSYKTSKYAPSIFILCVATNANPCVVALFAIADETSASICEALGLIKQFNTNWNPCSFVVDGCIAQRDAIKQLFPGWFLVYGNCCSYI